MGYSNKSPYSFENRSLRTTVYKGQSFDATFEQNRKKRMHESMDPKKALVREARDSDQFPESLPVILGLDITGSMELIPDHIVKDGLPTMISMLHERGLKDAAVLFVGLGDSRCGDRAPLQVGQFESSDEPMDMWCTRLWIEKGGGGNKGESYSLAWWFAANRCVTDAWEKRGQKGFIFTIGDDDCHGITATEFREVLGDATDIPHEDVSAEQLYKMASEKWNVYHFNLQGRQNHPNTMARYMGENLIQVTDHKRIPEMIVKIITSHVKPAKKAEAPATEGNKTPAGGVKVTL